MALTFREIAVLSILISCVPFQLWLSQLSSITKEEKGLKLQEIIIHSKLIFKKIFSPYYWILYLKEFYHTLFIKDYSKWYPDDNDPLGECPAVEVIKAQYPEEYFATSIIPRNNRPQSLKFRVGQVIRHKINGYTGVIIGWDKTCKAPKNWILQNHGENREWKLQPNYLVLVDIKYRSPPQSTYVVQENLEIIRDKVEHPQLEKYFDFFDGAQYICQSWLKMLYPLDQ